MLAEEDVRRDMQMCMRDILTHSHITYIPPVCKVNPVVMVEGNHQPASEELFLIIAIQQQSLPCLLNLDFLFTSSTTDYYFVRGGGVGGKNAL